MKKIFSNNSLLISILLIFNFTLNINNCTCQWQQVTNGLVSTTSIYSFTFCGNIIFAGTNNSGVYLSTNYGLNWSQTSLNGKRILSLATLGNNILAGTWQYGLYRSTNNGTDWTQIMLNGKTVQVLATSGNNIYAGLETSPVGDSGGVYVSTNFGANWIQKGIINSSVWSLAINGNNIFAGTVYNGLYFSTDNGSNWIQSALNNYFIYSLAILGNNIFAGLGGSLGVYRSTNNGINWIPTALNNKEVQALATIGNNIFAGAYDYSTNTCDIYLSTNYGTSWLNKSQGFSGVNTTIEALLIANNYIFAGTYGKSVWRRNYSEIIGVKNINNEISSSYSLQQNYPNPFNPTTNIRYDLPKNGFVKLVVYDELGREIETLVNEKHTAGKYDAIFNASQYPSGVYFYKLTTDNFSETKKMLLIK
jgi:photosystem II stability/assembly factor-like uncharacterized protein